MQIDRGLSEMTLERNLLISLLRLTKTGHVQGELVSRDSRVPVQVADEILKQLPNIGLISYGDGLVKVSSSQRVKIAVRAVELGADLERACGVLEWNEFEEIAAKAFEANDYVVKKRFRFKWAGRRSEIDVLGCKQPLVACVDCKHWRRGWRRSAIMRVVEAQVQRTQALAEGLPSLREKAGLVNWKEAVLVPMVLSLVPSPFKFYNKVPIVPVLQLPNFLNELSPNISDLTHFSAHL
jgi:Holliday junction resolvase-like predicted endonuclease